MTMRCVRCGAEAPDSRPTCGQCGGSLVGTSASPRSASESSGFEPASIDTTSRPTSPKTMCMKRPGGGPHEWVGCKCTMCGRKNHDWTRNCNQCATCLITRPDGHKWSGCTCTSCHVTRDEQHAWRACKCSLCGLTRNAEHAWEHCECSSCGRKRDYPHEWSLSRKNCSRCGVTRTAVHDYLEACFDPGMSTDRLLCQDTAMRLARSHDGAGAIQWWIRAYALLLRPGESYSNVAPTYLYCAAQYLDLVPIMNAMNRFTVYTRGSGPTLEAQRLVTGLLRDLKTADPSRFQLVTAAMSGIPDCLPLR